MPHAISASESYTQSDIKRSIKSKSKPKHAYHSSTSGSTSRDLRRLQDLYTSTRTTYLFSPLSHQIHTILSSKSGPDPLRITRLISLGLGSLHSPNQTRIMKQLVIFLDIVALIGQLQNQNEQSLNSDTGAVILELQIFAQDPSFSKLDEQLLHWLGVTILHTPSPTSGGEALSLIDENTVVYSPFLTFEAYKLFFERSEGKVGMWISDDFEALKSMGKGTRGEVDGLLRFFEKGKGWRRRVVGTGVGGEVAFWEEGEKAVPMAVYWKEEARKGKMVRMKSML